MVRIGLIVITLGWLLCACTPVKWAPPPTERSLAPAPLQRKVLPVPSAAPPLPVPSSESIRASEDRSKPPTGKLQPTFTEPLVPREETRAVVLLYHNIDLGMTPRSVWPWNFEAQLLELRKTGVEIIAMGQLVAFLEGRIQQLPAKVAVITIDDGEQSVYRFAFPILKKHRVPFALGIITRPVEFAEAVRAVSWDELREMLDSGLCEVAAHGHEHLSMPHLTEERLLFELTHSRELIEQRLNVRPDVFIYPLGASSTRVEEATQGVGYRAAFTASGSSVDHGVPIYAIPRFKVVRTTVLKAFTIFFSVAPYRPDRWGRGG